MTTTSSTSATATTAATAATTTSSVVTSAAQSLLTSLNAGSGVDTAGLVTSLVQAQYATQAAALQTRYDALTAQISSVATVKQAITSFSTALTSLVAGGTLQTQPVSANSAVVSATALPGARLAGLSSSIAVNHIAAAINAKGAGVSASVITDADGSAYLSLKGATGAAQAFTLQATTDPSGQLAQLNVGQGASGTTLTGTARNAKLTVDGVAVERASNTISDLVAGVKLQLAGISTTPVALTSSTPTDALSGAVSDFVDAYNAVVGILTTQTDPVNGALKSDTAAGALLQSLRGMTLAPLVTGGAAGTPTTLSSIGVGTNKDGTLSLNSATLTAALANAPQSVEAMFAFSADGSSGLSALLGKLTSEATDTNYGLGASTTSYTAAQGKVSDQQSDLTDQESAATTRLTTQFASMQAIVSSYKSTQSFLTNQIAAWNKSNS